MDSGWGGPTWRDLRHSHVSRLFAAGADPVYIAARVGDSVKTVLDVYAHEYSDARRRASESDQLAALYDRGSAVEADGLQQGATDGNRPPGRSGFAIGKAQRGAVDRSPSGILAKYVEKLLPPQATGAARP